MERVLNRYKEGSRKKFSKKLYTDKREINTLREIKWEKIEIKNIALN